MDKLGTGAAAAETGSLTDCGSFYKPSIQMGLQTLSIITLDLADPTAGFSATTTLGTADTVFSSATGIYLASYVPGYWFWQNMDEQQGTEFDDFMARRDLRFWDGMRHFLDEWDEAIVEFNGRTGTRDDE